jgi:MFS family permease
LAIVIRSIKEIGSFWRRQKKNWRTVVTRRIFNRFFNQLTLDYTNIYARELGASPLQLGTLNSLAGLANTALAIPVGSMHDRYSLRKLFIFGSGLVVVASLFYAIAYDWTMVIPAIILTRLNMRFHCSIICDLSLENKSRATGKSLCEGVGSTPSVFAPILAAFLITFFGGKISVDGIRPLYWIQFIAHSVLFIYIFTQLGEIERFGESGERGSSSFFGGLFDVFQYGSVSKWIVFYTVSMFTMSLVTPFWYPFASEIKMADQYIIGGMATIGIIITTLLATPIGRFADKIGRKKIYYLLNPIVALSYLSIILVPVGYPEILMIPALLKGFNMVIRIVILGSMTAELVSPRYIGRFRGLIGLFGGLAGIIAPIFGGIVWETFGPSYVFAIAFFLDIFFALPLMTRIPETLRK